MSIKPAYPNSSGSGGGGSGNDPTKLPLAGGTMTGDITLQGNTDQDSYKLKSSATDGDAGYLNMHLNVKEIYFQNGNSDDGHNNTTNIGAGSIVLHSYQDGTSTIFDNYGIKFPDNSVQMSAAFNQIIDINVTETGSNTIGYDLELTINFNGVVYRVPAREYIPE